MTSGTSRTYAERKAKGRPNVTLSMSAETRAIVDSASATLGVSRSAFVELCVLAYVAPKAKKRKAARK